MEMQIRDLLYGTESAPRILGKKDAAGQQLIPADGELTAGRLLAPLRHALEGWVTVTPPKPKRIQLPILPVNRAPYFCSGCPHNRSTALPEGSMGGGGIGCHAMVTISDRADSAVTGVTQMGGEGAQWIGQAFFTEASHIFQNVGDGTFFHSGQLAVQACIAAGVNITYKILYNDAVAMTGGQRPEGNLTVDAVARQVAPPPRAPAPARCPPATARPPRRACATPSPRSSTDARGRPSRTPGDPACPGHRSSRR